MQRRTAQAEEWICGVDEGGEGRAMLEALFALVLVYEIHGAHIWNS